MTAFVVAAAALAASLAPLLAVCARGRPIEGAIALELCATTGVLVLVCCSAAFFGTTFMVVAVVAAALAPVNTFVVARLLGRAT